MSIGKTRRVTALLLGLCSSCGIVRPPQVIPREATSSFTEQKLRERVRGFANFFATTVDQTSRSIAANSADRNIQRQALIWRIETVSFCRESARLEPPQVAFFDLWLLTEQMHHRFVHSSEGIPEPFRQELEDAAISLNQRIEDLGRSFLKDSQFEEAERFIQEEVARNPGHTTVGDITRTSLSHLGPSSQRSWLTKFKLPSISPFSGIDEGARAIREFTVVADRFAHIAEAYPEQLTWQAELLLLDLEERATTQTWTRSVETIAQSFQSLAEQWNRLPGELRGILAEAESSQASLQPTLRQLETASIAATATLQEARALGQELQQVSTQVTEAGIAWEATARAFGLGNEEATSEAPDSAPASPEEASSSFDIREYGSSAEQVSRAARELRALVEDVRELAVAPELQALDERAQATVQQTRQEAEDVVDHIAWRVIQLLGVSVVAALVYRWLRKTLFAQRPSSP